MTSAGSARSAEPRDNSLGEEPEAPGSSPKPPTPSLFSVFQEELKENSTSLLTKQAVNRRFLERFVEFQVR